MKKLTVKSYNVKIFVAGDYQKAVDICREFTFNVGLCVTVSKTNFVYTAGAEHGVEIGLVNYPRFPSDEKQIMEKAEDLAIKLMKEMFQTSVLIDDGIETIWFTTRD